MVAGRALYFSRDRASVLNVLVLVLVFIRLPIGIAALRGGQVIGCGAALEPSHCAEPQAQQVYQAFLHHRQGWKVLSHADNCLRRWASRSASSSTCWARIGRTARARTRTRSTNPRLGSYRGARLRHIGAFKSSGFNVQGAHGVAPAAVPCM